MPAFGENLRREREMRGVSLEEIASATKISLRFLEAIEREDFSKLPGGIFSRSFIRSYARYLGLDEERVIAEYQLAAHPQADFDLHRMATGKSESERRTTRTPLVAMLAAAILLAGGYVLYRYAPRAPEVPVVPPATPVATRAATPAGVPATATPSNATMAPGVPPAAGRATPGLEPGTTLGAAPSPTAVPAASGSAPAPSTTPVEIPPVAKPAADVDLVLQVAATDRAWVAVDADGKTAFQRVLNPNEVETVKAHRTLDVTAGNAQAVILTLNGETLKPLGRRGEVKTIHLTRDDLKNLAAPEGSKQ
jgi:cytoskeletal protein RodZ